MRSLPLRNSQRPPRKTRSAADVLERQIAADAGTIIDKFLHADDSA
jgi:hypothetical protein